MPQDPIRQIETEALQDLADEYRMLKVEQLMMKKRRDLARMKEGGDLDMGSMPSNTDFMKMARMMSDLSPEEQKRVANAYAVLKMADRGQMGGSLGLLGQLMGYARQNPGASEGQMINYLKLMDTQFSKGLELAKAVNPKQTEDSTLKFLGLMKELVIEGVRNPVLQAIEKSQPQPGVFEQILTRPELFSRAKEIGMFGGSNSATTHLDIELEKIRGERQLQGVKWELEMRRDELKRQAEDRRTENLLLALAPFAQVFAGPVSQRMQTLGQQQAFHHNPGPHNPTPPIPAVQLLCSCGYQGAVPITNPPQTEIPCPECGIKLTVGPSGGPPGGSLTEENP